MYKSNSPQDQLLLIDTATATGTGVVSWVKTGLQYIDVTGLGHLSIQTTGTFNVTQVWQVSSDNVNWVSASMQNEASVPLAENTGVVGAATGLYEIPVRGFRYFRINLSVFGSGTYNVIAIGRAGSAAPATQPVFAGQDTSPWVCAGNKTNNFAAAGSTNVGVLPMLATAANPTFTELNQTTGSVDLTGHTRVAPAPYPSGATPVNGFSGNVANANAVATLANAASKTTYITGFEITASGATTGLPVTVTVVGTITGTLSYTFVAPAGVLVAAEPLVVEFPYPIPASTTNTAIVVTCPALGAGNTNATAVAHGFQL